MLNLMSLLKICITNNVNTSIWTNGNFCTRPITITINAINAAIIAIIITIPAGNVEYNGYIPEEANLLYIYSDVGPASLS